MDTLAAKIEDLQPEQRLDVLIHGPNLLKLDLANQLWSRGFKCSLCDPGWSLDDVQDFAKETGATFIVIYQEKEETFARLRHLNNDRFNEKQVAIADLVGKIVKDLDESKIEVKSEIVPSKSQNGQITVNWDHFPGMLLCPPQSALWFFFQF